MVTTATEGRKTHKKHCQISFVASSSLCSLKSIYFYNCSLFSIMSGRSALARYFSALRPDLSRWPEIVEVVCQLAVLHVRDGAETVNLHTVVEANRPPFLLKPFLRSGSATLIAALGGSGKSLLALWLGMQVQNGLSLQGFESSGAANVLYCDWEQDAETVARTYRNILRAAGLESESAAYFKYRRCVAPLHEEAESIGHYIISENIGFVIIDSLGFACGGDKTKQPDVTRMFAAMRRWRQGTTSL